MTPLFQLALKVNAGGCSGENSFPQIQWENIPWGTKSLALIVENSSQAKVHLNLYNISPQSAEIPKLADGASFPSGSLGENGFGVNGWTGVCNVSPDDSYTFKIYALKSDLPSGISNMKSGEFEIAFDSYIIDVSELSVKY